MNMDKHFEIDDKVVVITNEYCADISMHGYIGVKHTDRDSIMIGVVFDKPISGHNLDESYGYNGQGWYLESYKLSKLNKTDAFFWI